MEKFNTGSISTTPQSHKTSIIKLEKDERVAMQEVGEKKHLLPKAE